METTTQTLLPEPLGVNPRSNEPILDQVLKTALDDEYKAYEAYINVIETFGAKPPFASIVEAEKRHQKALLELFEHHNIEPIENRWVGIIETPQSLQEAYAMGVEAEISNIAMYDTLLSYTENYSDVQEVFYRLQAASYNNHLLAFQSHLEPKTPHTAAPPPTMQSMDKMNEQITQWNTLVQNIANGQISQEEIMTLLSGANLSFIAGALLGATGASVLSTMTPTHEKELTKE